MANLKLINGKDEVVYNGVETIVCPTDSGSTQTYETFKPKQELSVIPDLSSGGQTVLPDTGSVLTKVTIEKPTTLIPENIASGVNIFGVVGTLESGGGSDGTGSELFPSQVLDFTPNAEFGGLHTKICAEMLGTSIFPLTVGNTYIVYWDSVRYETTATTLIMSGTEGVGIGNAGIFGLGENTGEPFIMGYVPSQILNIIVSVDTQSTHTVGVY